MAFTTIARGVYLEGLCADADSVWVSDPLAGGLYEYRGEAAGRIWLPERRWVGGLAFDAEGQILVSGVGGIVRLDPATGAAVDVVDRSSGAPLPGTNEMAIDDAGGFYFGSIDLPSIMTGKAPGGSALHYADGSGSVRKVLDSLRFSNGLAVSADGGTLFHNETWVGTSAYPIGPDGALGAGRMLLEKVDCDGMAIDADGVVWVTGFASKHIERLAPDGSRLDPLPLPGVSATSIRFGGPDRRDIFVTGVTAVAAEAIKDGRMPEGETSMLLKGRVDVPGLVRLAPVLPALENQHA